MKKSFSKQQFENFGVHLSLQLSGDFNMLTREAIEASGLTREEYMFCIENYNDLAEQHEST